MLYLCRAVSQGDLVYGSLVYSPKEKIYYIVENTGEELSFLIDDESTIGIHIGLGTDIAWEQLTKEEQEEWLFTHNTTEWEDRLLFTGDIIYNNDELGVIKYDTKTARFICEFDTWVVDFDHISSDEFEKHGNIINNPDLLNIIGKE